MISAQLGNGLGFPSFSSIAKTALNPIAATKASIAATKAVTKKSAAATVAVTKKSAQVVYQAHAIPTKWLALKPTEWLADKALAPVKSRVRTIVSRRAAKIAMDKRKSTTPTPAEVAEAKAWTKHKLMYDGPAGVPTPHGAILALFAGAPSFSGSGFGSSYYGGQLGVAPAVAAAAVPILITLANAMIKKYANSGEAPANPRADAQATSPAMDSQPEAPMAAGTQDLQPVQDAVTQAAAEAGGDPAAPAGGKGKHGGLPGGITKKHLMIGGAVIGGIVLISMLKK